MKRPYREGDWFAIPHGGGVYSPGIIVRGTRKLVRGYVFGERFDHVPSLLELSALTARGAAWSGVMSDRAIVHERWPVIGGRSAFEPSAWPVDSDDGGIAVPVALETLVRTGAMPRLARTVRDIGIERSAAALGAYENDTMLQWRRPLSRDALSAVEHWLAICGGASLRFYGASLEQLPKLATVEALRDLHNGLGAIPELPVFSQVRSLVLEREMPLATIARCFPNLRVLRLAAAHALVAPRELATLQSLEALDLSGAVISDLDGFAALPALRALRLHRTSGWSRMDALAQLPLKNFALEYQLHLIDIAPLKRMHALEELTLRGLWQFNVDAMDWIYGLAGLRRVTLDLGGRRRNVELYRRGGWASALPFEEALRAAGALASTRQRP